MTEIAKALAILVNPTTILAFLFAIVPGTISLRIYDRLRAQRPRKLSDSVVDILIASFINDTFWAGMVTRIRDAVRAGMVPSVGVTMCAVLAFLVSPILLTLAYTAIEDALSKFGLVSDAEPRPWDKWFKAVKREKKDVAVILIMKSDQRAIGGRYIPPGFASSEPAAESIHIGQTWEIDAVTGLFIRPIAGSLGIYVEMAEVETIEFLEWSSVEAKFPAEVANV